MRRYSENNENRYYACLPNSSSRSSQNSSSNSTNQNTHYQYYDPRLRTQQQAQQVLYEYQYSNASPNRSPAAFFSSTYQPPSFQELPSSSVNSISDLGEPISVFDDIKPLEPRRSIVASSLPTLTYVPPNPSRRPSVSDVRLATAHVIREQLLSDIERSITDIDQDLTALERRSSGPRYMPPRFSPIVELDAHDDALFGQPVATNQTNRLPKQKPIPMINSPVQKRIQQTSAHSTTKDRNSGSSQNWPNKQKRIYEVIPSLSSDSRKTSRQSSVVLQKENTKSSEIQSPQTPIRPIEKQASISSIQFRGQYHYGPEVEESEILSNDPEDTDHKSTYDELREASFHEILNADDFLRSSSVTPTSRALILVPEYSGDSRQGSHDLAEDLIETNQSDVNIARLLSAATQHKLASAEEVLVQDTGSFIQTAPEPQIDPKIIPRIASRSTITPNELYQETEVDIRDQHKPLATLETHRLPPSITTTPIVLNDSQEKHSPVQTTTIDSSVIVPYNPSSPTSPPLPISSSHPTPPPQDSNVRGLVAYFFSDFGNEGEGEEDTITIDQSNFVIPTGAEIIADDDLSGSLMGQSQASLLILHSAHVPRQQSQQQQQQQQQQLTSIMPLSIESNNERVKTEEKEEIGSIETDATTKRIFTSTLLLPSSPSPASKQVFPASIIDDMQTQFSRNNSMSNVDHYRRQSVTTPLNMDTVDSNREEQERHLTHSPMGLRSMSKTPQIRSRTQTNVFDINDNEIEQNNGRIPYEFRSNSRLIPLENIDNEPIQTPSERLDSADQRIKSSSSSSSRILVRRRTSTSSKYTNKDEKITPIGSPTRTLLKHDERENSISQTSTSRQPSSATSARSHTNRRKSVSSRRSSTNRQIVQSPSIFPYDQPTTPIDDEMSKTPTNDNEPQAFSVENEHFLHNQSPQTPVDFNRQLPSSYAASHPNDSRRSSTSSTLPVALDSPDNDNTQPPASRTATPERKMSISSIDPPADPNVLLTTTDDPDPDHPNIMNSTIHFQMLSSQQPHTNRIVSERDEPSPLVNIVPIEEVPIRTESVEVPDEFPPTEQRSHTSSPVRNLSRTDRNHLELNDQSRPNSAESEIRLPSVASSKHEETLPSNRTPSPSKSQHQLESTRASPLLSYPARLEDLMRPTPSPFLSAHEHENDPKSKHEDDDIDENQKLKQNDHSPFRSSPTDEIKQDPHPFSPPKQQQQPKRQHIPSPLDHNDNHSPSISPRSELSNADHTSVEGDENYRLQLKTPPISPDNDQIVSPDHHDRIIDDNNHESREINMTHNHDYPIPKQTLKPPIEPTFITEKQRRSSSQKSASSRNSSTHQQDETDDNIHRNDIHLSSASIKPAEQHFSPSSSPHSKRPTSNENDLPSMTASQQHSKLSLRVKQPELKRKQMSTDQTKSSLHPPVLSPLPQNDKRMIDALPNDDNSSEEKAKQRRRRRVSFSSSVAHFQFEDRQLYANWRERVAAILASKHRPNEKYAHVKSRVNSFANFEYQPKKIKVIPKRKQRPKVNEENKLEESKFLKRKTFKVKRPKNRQETDGENQTDEELLNQNSSEKTLAPQIFGRLWCLPDGSPTVFHEPLAWNVQSKLKSYSYENFHHEPPRSDFKIFNQKLKWHSESKLADLIKESPRYTQRPMLMAATSMPMIPDRDQPYFYQQKFYHQPGIERKIFDIQSSNQYPTETHIQSDNISHGSRPSDSIPIFHEKLEWTGKSKLKDTTWQNINYQPKKSKVQIVNKNVHWNSEPKIRTRSPSTIHPSRATTSQVQIFDKKLNWDAQAKVHCWSEIDLRQLGKKKSIFAQYHDPKWNDIVTPRIDSINYHYPKLSNNVEIFSDRPIWTRNSGLKDYIWENFDYKSQRRSRQSNNQKHLQESDQSPANRPKWNAVSKTRSVNSVYNPKVTNSNTIRRGWDRELRRKRVHKLPPLKRKREREQVPQLAIEQPTTNGQLAIDYNYEHSSTTQGRTTSNGYVTTSSRRSSKALVPINRDRRFFELELPNETPRSQRPIQQEWYDEMNKSRLTHRTDMGRTSAHSFRNSIDLNHQANTPRELVTFRSSTRNSQNSVMSGTLLDSSVRTNRTTEFRLSKDMEEHHHHSHTPSQSMPIEIRGFQLEGTPLTVPDHATIRPLSNVSYGASERVKSRRVYPWSSLHPHGTSSRNSSLVPIAEFRHTSLESTINEVQTLIHEE